MQHFYSQMETGTHKVSTKWIALHLWSVIIQPLLGMQSLAIPDWRAIDQRQQLPHTWPDSFYRYFIKIA